MIGVSWSRNYLDFGHDVFIAFIECKIEGKWNQRNVFGKEREGVLICRDNSENNIVHVIEPDGLRRILQFGSGTTISINQNIFSYTSDRAREITIDEKEQSGKGKTRDIL